MNKIIDYLRKKGLLNINIENAKNIRKIAYEVRRLNNELDNLKGKRKIISLINHDLKEIEYDVLKAATDQIKEADIKIIEVDNCQECPFVVNDNEYGYHDCNIGDMDIFDLKKWEELPEGKVYNKCPLKNNNYKIKLK